MTDAGAPERRQGTLTYERDSGLLVVGARTALLEPDVAVDGVVGTYVDLVVAQRAVTPHSHLDLRNRELVQLSDLLALPQAELDALIDRELARLLGTPVLVEAATSPTVPDRPSSPGRRRVLLVAGLGAAATAAVALTVASIADVAAVRPRIPTGSGDTVEIIELPGGGTATRTESAPVPPAEDGTEIGSSVVIERNP